MNNYPYTILKTIQKHLLPLVVIGGRNFCIKVIWLLRKIWQSWWCPDSLLLGNKMKQGCITQMNCHGHNSNKNLGVIQSFRKYFLRAFYELRPLLDIQDTAVYTADKATAFNMPLF